MRQVVLDTETTGISPKDGHRLIEIGCVELVNRQLTGEHYHVYLNPEREVDRGAFEVHGLSNEFLADKPLFADVAKEFLSYIEGAELIIHNAPFDVGFLDHELKQLPEYADTKIKQVATVCDTLVMARQMYPGQRNSLDALCKRLGVNNAHRTLHGALLDSQILADVYLLLTGGQQALFAEESPKSKESIASQEQSSLVKPKANTDLEVWDLPIAQISEAELKAHEKYLKKLASKSGHEGQW